MKTLSPADNSAFNTLAQNLNVEPSFLDSLINKESRWEPQIKNPISSARGLIQFMDSTAIDMGYSGSLDIITKYPTIETQLQKPVWDYLKRYMPFATNAELYLSVFYPALRKQNYNEPFPANVVRSNPRIKTPAHYVAFVEGKLTELENGEINIEDLVKPNLGYSVQQGVKTAGKTYVKTQDVVSSKKKIAVAATISLLTIGTLLYYTYKKSGK